ncbi:prenyltransferase/squalene oxidase repeat-containing protein [Streptomyces jumonjinensis]|uniref:prenyltransferase/squalene oxidase repeat-containing protein n=1 Tax=Streptomyces jumonjinensis TaxID=1945 RepID=UPI0037AD8BEF
MHEQNKEHPAVLRSLAGWRTGAARAAAELIAEMAAYPRGTMSPSVYETARLVSDAPWLDGHDARCAFLLRTQRPDGWWGQPDGYALVPTLSAVEALLRERDRPDANGSRPDTDRSGPDADGSRPSAPALARAALRGLWALADELAADHPAPLPDTIAAELIVPWLVEEVNDRLDGSGGRLGATALVLPDGVAQKPPARLRTAVATGQTLPEKLWHTLEVLGEQAADAPGVRLVASAVGSSPAATAAWLAGRPRQEAPASLLREIQARWGGPVPGVTSIAVFESAWVLGWLLDAGVPVTIPPALSACLTSSLGPSGAPAGPGLPADADDTAAVLHTLALAGRPAPVHSLWSYEADDYFVCFPHERTPSTSTNAHVLEALLDAAPPDEPAGELARRRGAAHKAENWLLAQQHPDGSWDDKWHASAYYATMCCTVALARGHHPDAANALARAARWTLASQRPDGSWGRWEGTVEETSYAIQTVLRAHPADLPPPVALAVAGGCGFLLDRQEETVFPPLWHDKDLYAPVTVVKSARVAALHAAAARLASAQPTGSAAAR